MALKTAMKERILNKILEESRKGKRQAFLREGEQIMQFAQRHYGPENPDYDKEEFWSAKITKTAEARQLFGNAIYQQNPTVLTEMKAVDPAAKAEADCMVAYLTQAMKETRAERYRKRAVDQAVTWGRGVVHTVLDKEGRPTSRWFPVKDFFQDLDALSDDEIRWRGRRRYSQRSELERKFKKSRKVISEAASVDRHPGGASPTNAKGDERYFHHDPCDIVEWMVLYFRVGLHNFKGGLTKDAYDDSDISTDKAEERELDNGARRYVLIRNGDRYQLVDEGPWDIPFWRISSWPIEPLDLIDDDEGCMPISPLSAGLPWEKAINELTQKALSKSHFNLRDIIIVMQNHGIKMSEEDIARIVNGDDIEVVTPEAVAQDAKASDAVHHFQFSPISPEFSNLLAMCEMYFEKATGLNEILYSGQGGSQFRNAAAANLAAEASTSRVDEFKQRVEEWSQRLATNESFAARVLLNRDDIQKMVGPAKAQAWRELAPPAEIQRQRLMEEMPGIEPEMLEQLLEVVMQGTVSLDEWVHEWYMSIVPGSAIRPSLRQQQAVAERLMNQPFAAAVSNGMIEPAMAIMDFTLEVNQAPPDVREAMKQSFMRAQQQMMQAQQMQQQQAAQQPGPPQPSPPPPPPPGA